MAQSILTKRIFERGKLNNKYKIRFISNSQQDLKKSILSNSFYGVNEHLSQFIIHIHGGGFITTTSSLHQRYLNKFTTRTGLPIFAIDYPLAPEYKAEQILNTVFKSFLFIITLVRRFRGGAPKFVLIGDSAGGNLCLALLNWIVINNLPKPARVILNYPAVDLNFQRYTDSYLVSLEDRLLSFTFLLICYHSYLNSEDDPTRDFMLSPIKTPDAIIKQYPKVNILFGTEDPLHDDIIRYTLKLIKLGVDIQTFKYVGFQHGILNLDVPLGIKYASFMINKNIHLHSH